MCMLQLGEKQILVVEKTVPMGVYLIEKNAPEGSEHVLLPRRQVPEGAKPGDEIEVFLYKDSEDRLIATCKMPLLMLHQVGWLTVKDVGRIGAFLDWGLEKDLLLPFHEQPSERVQKDQRVLAAVYIDKSSRLCATMNVYPYLRQDSPYHTGDEVDGTVYMVSDNFGVFVAVDDIFSALIPRREVVRSYKVGDKVHARVTKVKEDGKLDLSVREKSYLQIGRDTEFILQRLNDNGGSLPLNDTSSPEEIRREMEMSKNEFKRAVGHLLKEHKIVADEKGIHLAEQ